MAKMKPSKNMIKSEFKTWDFYINSWDHNYCFSVNKDSKKDNHYEESGHFTLNCTVTYPDNKNGNIAKLYFIPSKEIDSLLSSDMRSYNSPPNTVGSINTRKNNLNAYINIPWQSYTHILQLLNSNTFKYVQLHGRCVRKNILSIRSVMFAKNDPEES